MIELNVPYSEKDLAKRAGARWNGRTWYEPGDTVRPELMRWYDGDNTEDNTAESVEAVRADDNVDTAVVAGELDDSRFKTVTEVNRMIARTFDNTVTFYNIMVKGEVTNYTAPNNGNYYFAIKDSSSLINCYISAASARRVFDFTLEKGKQVAIVGNFTYYPNTCKAQIEPYRMIDIGEGAANRAYRELCERLRAEGLFDAEHKKELPQYPRKVGVITSKGGKAIGDICTVAKKRNPYIQIVLYHVNVQGKNAVATIVEAIEYLDAMEGVDVIILGRGGGSQEELISYNSEAVARTVYNATTPIISAVGHATDIALIDEVADAKATTPTLAATMAIPDVMTDIKRVANLRAEMKIKMDNQLSQRKLLLNAKKATLEKYNPETKLKLQTERLEKIKTLLRQNMDGILASKKNRYEVLLARLNGLSPTAKLINGFGYISANNKPVQSVDDVNVSDEIQVTVHDGTVTANVTMVEKGNNYERK